MSLWYRWWYSWEMLMAYLASNMGDSISMHNHLSMADRVYLKWWKEQR